MNVIHNFPIPDIVKATDGYSGSDLRELCRYAAMLPVRELLKQQVNSGGVNMMGVWVVMLDWYVTPICMICYRMESCPLIMSYHTHILA